MNIAMTVNDQRFELDVEPRITLVDALRDRCGLTGTHVGCEHGVCGACTIVVDGSLVRSCLMLAVQADGCSVTTVEGLADQSGPEEILHPVQEALVAHHGLQCGFCTPGILMSARHLLQEDPHPSREKIRAEMAGNICRCTGYQTIVDAIEAAAATMAGLEN